MPEHKLTYLLVAAVVALVGKIVWAWLNKKNEPTRTELLEELKTQQAVMDLERRVASLEMEVKGKISGEVFTEHAKTLEVISQQQSKELEYVRRQLDELLKESRK